MHPYIRNTALLIILTIFTIFLVIWSNLVVLDNGRVAVDGPRDLVIQKLQAKKTA